MTAKQATPRVVLLLLLLGAALVSLRIVSRDKSRLPPGDSLWQLTYDASFHARKNGARLRISFPLDTRYARVSKEEVVSPDLDTKALFAEGGTARDMLITTRKTGAFQFTARIDIHLSERPSWREMPKLNLSTEARARYLGDEAGIQASDPVVDRTLERLRIGQKSNDELVEMIFNYCHDHLGPGGDNDPQDALTALTKGVAGPLGKARAMVALCRAAKVPARLVAGFEIKESHDARPHTWVEALSSVNGEHWDSYDPLNGFALHLPHYFLPARRERVEIVRSREVSDLMVSYAIVPLPMTPGTFDLQRHQASDILDLKRLPVEIQGVLALILLLPLGALVTAVVRTIIGLRTFGTFTPTLLALSFVYNDWRTGLLVFLAVMLLGFSSRNLLDRLKLLLVPRLGIILTLVVLCIVFSISTLDHFGFTPGAHTVMLPMVILTMLVERFYVTTEEDSMHFAVQLLIGTLAMSFVVYALLCWKTVGDTLLDYPELHCFTVVALILVGRYTGYRWTELWRFRDLSGKND